MSKTSLQHESQSFVYSQTRNLPLETWQEIFWLASHIEDTDEFISNVGSYNRNIWDGRNVVNAPMAPQRLSEALRMRQNITLVCKAWYAMGINILYSHIRISSYLWDDPAALQHLVDNPQLLSHTKRLTITPNYKNSPDLNPSDGVSDWTVRRWACLSRLQILDAPGDVLLSVPDQNLPSSLTVAVFRGMRNRRLTLAHAPLQPHSLHAPWCNIRILKIDFNSLNLSTERRRCYFGEPNFASVEELYFNEGHRRDEQTRAEILESISAQLKFPKLHTLSICNFHWHGWWGFLEAHSRTLKILNGTTSYGGGFGFSQFHTKIELPALEEFYLDHYTTQCTVVAGNVTRLGLHGVGCAGDPNRMTTEGDKWESLRRLLLTFDYWRKFPAATTYRVTGWHEVLKWLEKHPEVIKYIAKLEKCGVGVKFIQMKEKHSYARESVWTSGAKGREGHLSGEPLVPGTGAFVTWYYAPQA